MPETPDLSTVDLNLLLRDALHHWDVGDEVSVRVEEACARVVSGEAAGPLARGVYRAIERCAEELGGSPADAAHTMVANEGRFFVNVGWSGDDPGDTLTEESYVPVEGGLRRLAELPPEEQSRRRRSLAGEVPEGSLEPVPSRAGGCLGLLALVSLAAWMIAGA